MEAIDPTASDEALMLRLKCGEEAVLAELMRRWELPVKRFIFRVVGNTADAAELAEETFVRVYFRRETYHSGHKFSSWLFAIAANQAKNRLRWWKRRPVLSLDEWRDTGGDTEDSNPAPDVSLDAGEAAEDLAARVQVALAALSHENRTAIVLFEYENRSMAEIATIMDCSAKAVENRLYRARCELRRLLAQGDMSSSAT